MLDSQFVVEVSIKNDIDIDENRFPFTIPAIRNLNFLEFDKNVTFFVGENGAGKSTLLEAIAESLGFGAEGGTKDVRFNTVETNSGLGECLRVSKGWRKPRDAYFLRAESFYNVATFMDSTGGSHSYGRSSLHECSHGEAFMSILVNKLRGNGIYLLDEPEAALSPNRQLAALVAIKNLTKQGSQFIIATHSPILLSFPGAKIYQFDSTGIYSVEYEDTEHYTITKDFLSHYKRRVSQLLEGEDD